jgi:hypothetical protein
VLIKSQIYFKGNLSIMNCTYKFVAVFLIIYEISDTWESLDLPAVSVLPFQKNKKRWILAGI